jgi:hypothetical protein
VGGENVENQEEFGADWPAPPAGRFYACALRDRLVARARAGDPVALQALLMLVPDDAPPSFCRAERDRELRQLSDELFAAHPAMTLNGVATLLAAAGDRIESGRRTLTILVSTSWSQPKRGIWRSGSARSWPMRQRGTMASGGRAGGRSRACCAGKSLPS